jgi:hypothetical protein
MKAKSREITDGELEAYLDEALAVARMAEIEQTGRRQSTLNERLARINARRDSGLHTLGEIWRRHQIGVPSREDLGKYLMGIATAAEADYIRFRVETLQCRYTIANLEDLRAKHHQTDSQAPHRQTRHFQSTVGRLKEPG